jgi:hypothetical protein
MKDYSGAHMTVSHAGRYRGLASAVMAQDVFA